MKQRHNRSRTIAIVTAIAIQLSAGGGIASAQQPVQQPGSPAPSGSNPPVTGGQPSGVQPAPSGNSPQAPAPAPGSNARPVTPAGQVEQSIQPTTQADQQGRGTSAQPVTQPQTPTGGNQAPAQPAPNAPATQVPPAQSPQTPGRESVPTPVPENLPAVPQIAPEFEANNPQLPDLGRVGVDMTDQHLLSVRQAIEMALANNKDIEVARQNVKIAEFDLKGSRGAYDPKLSSQSYYERSENPSASFLSGSATGAVIQSDITATARLEGLTPAWGGGYRVDLSAIRLTTNNLFSALNPQYPTALTFSYTQPLLRGLRMDQSRRQIEIAKKNLTLTDAQFRQRAIETITNVQRTYWDLVFALRNLQIQRDAVRDARAQLEHNKRLVEQGMLAPIDVVAAEAQLTGFEQTVYTALEEVSRAENNLKNLIAPNKDASLWREAIVPSDPVNIEPPVIEVNAAVETALQNRPEVQQSNLAREINQIDQKYFKEQTKPQVDLIGSYGTVGLAGPLNTTGGNPFSASNQVLTQRVNELIGVVNGLPGQAQQITPIPPSPPPAIPDEVIGGLGTSFNQLARNTFNNFRMGVQVSLPLKNRTAEAQLGRSLVEGQRITTQREQLEQNIQVDVRNALQLVRTGQSRLVAAAATRAAAEQQYSSEQRKFDAGQSTLFLVLERQTALTTARGNELRAQTDLNKAIADLQRATGNALTANNIVAKSRG
jgi:outer membrane protein